jgi:hypothetical protein
VEVLACGKAASKGVADGVADAEVFSVIALSCTQRWEMQAASF